MSKYSDALRQRLIREEGWRNKMYKDSKGIWTIGVGYNIQERGLPDDIIDALLARTQEEARQHAKTLPAWEHLNGARQTVLTAMVFQMGLPRVKGFVNFLAACEDEDWQKAHDEMLDSKWARDDSPGRARREAAIMLAGELDG
jgi:lysozyme